MALYGSVWHIIVFGIGSIVLITLIGSQKTADNKAHAKAFAEKNSEAK